MEERNCPMCSQRKKERSPEEYKKLINRLSRIEGQIRGIRSMVENGAYCPDILVQSAAANAALNAFNKELRGWCRRWRDRRRISGLRGRCRRTRRYH